MRKKLFDWHLGLGKYAGALILVWATSGAVMTVQPTLVRWADPGFPKLKAEAVKVEDFTIPPSRLPAAAGGAVALRRFAGRSWYEVTGADGAVNAFDSRTGRPVPAALSAEEISADLSAKLRGGRWTPGPASLLERYDDYYRKGRLPVYKVAVAGPGGITLYVSARDGAVEAVWTRWARAVRWAGLGVHTWNFAAVMRAHDDERGLLLCLLVALPLAALALVAYFLLVLRGRSARKSGVTRAAASAVVASLLLQCVPAPASAAIATMVRTSAPVSPVMPIVSVPGGLGGSTLGLPLNHAQASLAGSLSAPLSLPSPVVHSPSAVLTSEPQATALAASAVSPKPTFKPGLVAASVETQARALPPVAAAAQRRLSPAGAALESGHEQPASDKQEPVESLAASARALFDGARMAASRSDSLSATPLGSGGAGGRSLDKGSNDGSGLPPSVPPPPSGPSDPSGSNRKAVWGLYVTHALHIASLSLIWRIAWPLFVLDGVGKAGLGLVGTVDQFSDLALGVVAGIVIDRLLPSRSMAAAALVRAGVGVALAAVALAGAPGAPFLLGFSAVHAFAMTVIYLGQAAVSPAAAGGDATRLQRLNIAFKIITTAVAIPGSYVGGWLVGAIGVPAAFAAYAALNALVLAPLYAKLLPKKVAAETKEEAGPRPSLREVVRFVLGSKVLLGLFTVTAAAMTFAEPFRNTVLPIVAKELLHGGPVLLGHMMTALYAGQLLGVLALLKWSKKVEPRWWIGLSALGLASFWLFALVPLHAPMLYVAVFAVSLLTQPAATMIKTLIQKEVADRRPELLGRTLGVHLMFYALAAGGVTAFLAWAFSAFTGSFLAPIVPVAFAYTGLGVVVLFLVLAVLKDRAPPPAVAFRKLLKPAAVAAGLALGVAGLAWSLSGWSVLQIHIMTGKIFGFVILWQAFTGTSALLRESILERFDPKLPEQAPEPLDASSLSVTPDAAEAAALASAGEGAKVRAMTVRSAPSSGRKSWYEFVLEDGQVVAVHGRTGKVMRSPRSAVFILEQANHWLAGSAWTVKGEPELLTEEGEYYRKGEVPHYRVRIQGPGAYEAYFSARDGRLLAVHSRLSRVLRWVGMGLHAWGIKALRKHDALKRLVAPLLLGVPLATLAGTALWMRIQEGFALTWPSWSSSPWTWHVFFGSYALFALLLMAVTGPLTLLIPLVNKHVTPKLPPAPAPRTDAFKLSPAQALAALSARQPGLGEPASVAARSSSSAAWYDFELADGRTESVSAEDGAKVETFKDAAFAAAEAERWLAGSPWSIDGMPVLQEEYDDLYRKGEVPVYRARLKGPGGFQVYLSARDGRPMPQSFSRLERFLERRVYGMHAHDAGAWTRYAALRRVTLLGFVVLPIVLTVLAAMAGLILA